MSFTVAAGAAGSLGDFLKSTFADFAFRQLLVAVAVAVVCLIVIKVLMKLVDSLLDRATQMDGIIRKLIRTALKVLFLFIGVLIVLGCLGISITSLVAVLSVVGLAVSLAVQGFLSNVAGGLQLVASKPFKEGDFVDVGGCTGTVHEIGLVYTKLNSGDNKLIQIPNSAIVAANIINFSSEDKRRVELNVCASYAAPVEQVKAVLTRLVGEHPLTLATPEPLIHVSGYLDSSIEYIVRVWCATEDYWTVYFELLDSIKPAFDAAGVEMSYPHVNVHMMDTEVPKS